MRKRPDRLYYVWAAIVQRCTNPNARQYKDYGGRGIKMCDRWRKSYSDFAADMGPRLHGMTIERIDNNGDYEPSNCKWATRKEQNSNKRNCIYLVRSNGARITLREYCRIHDLRYRPIVKRIQDRGWPIEMAISFPVGGKDRNDAIMLWERNEELRQYLALALDAIDGRPVLESILNTARRLCVEPPMEAA